EIEEVMIIWVDQAIALLKGLHYKGIWFKKKQNGLPEDLVLKPLMLPTDGLQSLKNEIDLAHINEEENRQVPQLKKFHDFGQNCKRFFMSMLQKISSTAMRRHFFGNSSQVELSPMDL